jgi:hypothetical protein
MYGGGVVGAGPIVRAAVASVVGLAWSSVTARADGAVMVVGSVSPRDRDVIVGAIQGAGTALSLRFTAPAWTRDATAASVACLHEATPWSCLSETVHDKDQLVIVEVQSDGGIGAPMTVVTAHLVTSDSEAVSFASRSCEVCSEDALKRTVGDLSRDLLQRAAAQGGRTRLAIRARPVGALVALDGQSLAAAEITVATYPGKHLLAVRAAGHAAVTREVLALEGATTEVALALDGAERPGDGGGARARRWVGGVALGTGAAAIAAGALLIAFDQDPDPEHHYYYDTAKYGVVSLLAGALVTGAGAYLLIHAPDHAPATGASVTALPRGAALGWTGRF